MHSGGTGDALKNSDRHVDTSYKPPLSNDIALLNIGISTETQETVDKSSNVNFYLCVLQFHQRHFSKGELGVIIRKSQLNNSKSSSVVVRIDP